MTTLMRTLGIALPMTVLTGPALAATLNFSGTLDFIEFDNGGVFSGTPLGTTFTGSVNLDTGIGVISNGTTTQDVSCCIAAGGLSVTNNEVLTPDEALLINFLLGTTFSDGDIVDIIDIEGDHPTAGGGRIEVGLSYLLEPTAFDDDSLDNFPFDPVDLIGSAFFIYEEDAVGDDLYSGVGLLTAVPLPAAAWLFGGALLGLAGVARRRGAQSQS